MQKNRIIITLFFCIVCIMTDAQVLTGYVKTKGRIGENGGVIPGKRLSGVTVIIHGASPLLTMSDGSFSVYLKNCHYGDKFRIDSVQKKGYELVDKDFCNKTFIYTKDTLVIVLDTISDIFKDRLEMERRLRRTLQRKLQEKEEELEEQMAQNLITKEEYRDKLQELYSQQENNEKFIGQMAEKYSQYDYDQMDDEFNRKLIEYILAGELETATSLLIAKGNFIQRLEEIRKEEEVSIRREDELHAAQDKLHAAQKRLNEEKLEIASDLYNRSELLKLSMEYDSAMYYIGLRSELDTTNVRWNLDAGNFIVENILTPQNESVAHSYFQRALNNTRNANVTYLSDKAYTYLSIGNLYYEQGNFRQAQDNYSLSLRNFTEDDEGYAQCVERVAVVYNSMKQYSEAEQYHKLAIKLYSKRFGQNHNSVAYCYNNIGAVYENMEDLQNSEKCYSEAINIWKRIYGEDYLSSSIAVCYNNLGGCYDKMKDYDKALEYYQKSLEAYIACGVNLEKNINIACVYNNIGSTYYNMSDYVNALTYYGKALKIMRIARDTNHPDVRTVQENIAVVVGEMSQ